MAWAGAAVAVLLAGVGAGLLSARPQHPPAAAPGPPAADGWWQPLPTASGPFVPAELVVERLHLQAPVEVKGIDAHNVMEAPDRPADAAWYGFTAMPGSSSNAVFSGWSDYGRAHGAAAFLHLDQLAPGDLVDVVSARRTEVRYRVTRRWEYALAGMPMQDVLARAPVAEVTLITTSGTLSPGLGYDHRLVVRAVRAR
jgi:hypothetical protein